MCNSSAYTSFFSPQQRTNLSEVNTDVPDESDPFPLQPSYVLASQHGCILNMLELSILLISLL